MTIKVMPFLHKKGNRVAKGTLSFDDLPGFQLGGFTICENDKKELYVMFPSTKVTKQDYKNACKSCGHARVESERLYFFLHAESPAILSKLEDSILDVYEQMTNQSFNNKSKIG